MASHDRRSRARSRNRISTPQSRRADLTSNLRRSHPFDRIVLGLANRYGTSSFLIAQTVIIAVWVTYNLVSGHQYLHSHPLGCTYSVNGVTEVRDSSSCNGVHPFDFFPFVLLNLAFSLEAAYAAPMILYAQRIAEAARRSDAEAVRRARESRQAEVDFLAREIAEIRNQLGQALTRDYLRRRVDELNAAGDD